MSCTVGRSPGEIRENAGRHAGTVPGTPGPAFSGPSGIRISGGIRREGSRDGTFGQYWSGVRNVWDTCRMGSGNVTIWINGVDNRWGIKKYVLRAGIWDVTITFSLPLEVELSYLKSILYIYSYILRNDTTFQLEQPLKAARIKRTSIVLLDAAFQCSQIAHNLLFIRTT